jgi:hypothetical protein
MLENPAGHFHFGFGLMITADVVAVAEIAADHHQAVEASFEGSGHDCRVNPARAHNPDNLDIRGIL